MSDQPILIIGANGKTGARVAGRLLAIGVSVRPVSRSTEIAFDWNRPETWAAALEGCRSAYVTFQPDLSVPGAASAIKSLAVQARNCGIEHLVLLSGRGEPGAQAAELALMKSGIDWTVIRSAWFAQNFSENFLADLVLSGEVALPVGAVPEPFVDVEDIAEIAVAALTDRQHRGKLYEVTGPRAITFAEAVGSIAAALERPVVYRTIPVGDFADGMRHAGLPQEAVALVTELFTEVLDGRNCSTASGVLQALGRPARDFSEYVQQAVSEGAWAQEAAA
jgi:uncharacterized protein YbjT (DUF2867 family)